jgi:hypothetical protein
MQNGNRLELSSEAIRKQKTLENIRFFNALEESKKQKTPC